MRRFFVDEIGEDEGSLSITGPEAKHISKVLRMGPGDRLILMDGKGRRFQALIESSSPREVRVIIEEKLSLPPSPPVEIILCQSILKSNAMDYMVQKTSELGVTSIFPILSEKTVIKVDDKWARNKLDRWREIAWNAAKQSDKDRPAEITPLMSLEDSLSMLRGENAFKMILWEEEEAIDLKGLMRSIRAPARVIAIIGPEGGLSEREVNSARHSGFTPVSLGNRILRAETAAIALVTVVQYEWGDLGLNKSPSPVK